MDPLPFLHNVSELIPEGDFHRISRVPSVVREGLNEGAREVALSTAGVEIRARVGGGGGQVLVSVNGSQPMPIEMYLGDHFLWSFLAGPGEHEIGLPGDIRYTWLGDMHATRALAAIPRKRFAPDVMRVAFPYGGDIAFGKASGALTPAGSEDLPAQTLLTYGSSITQGMSSLCAQSGYSSRLALELGMDHINLGFSGSAHCEPAIADHIAARDDWDCCTLEMGGNMLGFSTEAFSERVRGMVERIGGRDQTRRVFCLDMFRFFNDLPGKDDAKTRAFREIVRDAVADLGGPNTHHIPVAAIPSWHGLAADILHPNERGMEEMALHLRDEIKTFA